VAERIDKAIQATYNALMPEQGDSSKYTPEFIKAAKELIKPTSINGLWIVHSRVIEDKFGRGPFMELAKIDEIEAVTGMRFDVQQWNESRSNTKVLRGMHDEPWRKLVKPTTGQMVAVIVDVRPDSPTFGKYEMIAFDADNEPPKMLAIDEGLANSVCVTGDSVVRYEYLVTKRYVPGMILSAISPFDPDLAIPWPVKDPLISERDRDAPKMRERFPDNYN
jgi:dTDP-4-dehydrorhamnose 3,5-epimerase